MAGELNPQKYREISELLKEIRRGYAKLEQENPFKDQTVQDFVNSIGDADAAIISLVDEVSKLDRELDGVTKNSKGFFQTLVNVNSELKKSSEPLNVTKKSINSIQGITAKLKDDQQGINRLNQKQLKQLKDKLSSQISSIQLANNQFILDQNGDKLQGNALKQRLKSLVTQGKITQAHSDTIAEAESNQSVLKDINNQISDRIDEEKKITNQVGLTGQALQGASGILKKLGVEVSSDKFKSLEEGARNYAEELSQGDENLSDSEIRARVLGKTLRDGAEAFSEEIGVAIDAAIIKFSKNTIKKFGEDRSALAKTFALGRAEANGLKESLNFTANSSGELNFSIADAVQSMQSLNAQLGTAVNFTQDELMTFSLLSDELGLSVEQSAQFVQAAKLRGEDAKDYAATLRGEIKLLAAVEGLAINQQEVFASIGEMSAATRLSIQGQGKSLADAAFQAAKLGMNQSQLEKTSSSLLDFESSIAAEMEAELMTGKQLNLEDARRAALMDDQEGLAKAISREIGTAADFQEMNVFQQRALAKAFGMSREELAETLEQQEMLTKFQGIGAKSQKEALQKYNELKAAGVAEDEIARRLGDEQLAQQLASQAAQERFQKSLTKLKDAFVPILDKLAGLLDMLADGVEFLTESKILFTSIAKIVGIIAGVRLFGRMKAGFNVIKGLAGQFKNLASAASGAASNIGNVAAATGSSAGASAAKAAASSTAKAASSVAGGAATSAVSSAGSSSVFGKIGGFFKKLNPLDQLKNFFKTGGPKFLKNLAKKVPLFGSLIEGIFATSDIRGMIASGQTGKELNQAVGKRVLEAVGSVGGAIAGGTLGSLIPIPGVGTIIGSIGGDMLGRYLAGLLADNMDVSSIGKIFTPKETQASEGIAEDFIMRPGQGIQKFRKDDIIIGGTNLLGGGENGNEVVTLLKELISAVKQGGDVYIDGAKAGKSLALATSRMG